ncbi:MAG: hypothetical protein N2234_00350 [Planctomycetota bacterium]|nr:hypothetical protein [Planctomycetota bacterium]
MRVSIFWFSVSMVAVVSLALVAQDEEIDPRQLGENLKEYLGRSVVFTDELAYFYRDVSEYTNYLKFDTRYVSCRLEVKEEDDQKILMRYAMGELRTLKDEKFKDSRLELLREILFNEREPHPVIIKGEVVSPEIYEGDVQIVEVKEVERARYKR